MKWVKKLKVALLLKSASSPHPTLSREDEGFTTTSLKFPRL